DHCTLSVVLVLSDACNAVLAPHDSPMTAARPRIAKGKKLTTLTERLQSLHFHFPANVSSVSFPYRGHGNTWKRSPLSRGLAIQSPVKQCLRRLFGELDRIAAGARVGNRHGRDLCLAPGVHLQPLDQVRQGVRNLEILPQLQD